MEDNKAIDEMTKKDIAEKLKQEQQEIEINFPSYFDEFQRNLLSLTAKRDPHHHNAEVKIEIEHREVRME
jgi:hypothetical protein